MKANYIKIFLLLVITISSCVKDDKVEFSVYPKELNAEGTGGIFTLNISTDEKWTTDTLENWFKILPVSGYGSVNAEIVINPNQSSSLRSHKFKIYSQGDSAIINISQNSSTTLKDGSVMVYEKNRQEKASNLVFMGDGFIEKDMWTNGKYYLAMKEAIEYFFDVEPFKTYRKYFNVYIVTAVSQDEGASMNNEKKNTIFDTKYLGNTDDKLNSSMQTNVDKVFQYAKKVDGIDDEELKKTTVVLIVNHNRYGGTTTMYNDGRAVAIVPMNRDKRLPGGFKHILVHEAGGHGFGGLADEYLQGDADGHPLSEIAEWEKFGYYSNVSIVKDTALIKWKDFFRTPGYEIVNVHEGGFYRKKGVWRPEINSCMNDNRLYFNAPSRKAIVLRIMKNAGEVFTMEKFISKDVNKLPPDDLKTRALYDYSVPKLPPPNLIKVE